MCTTQQGVTLKAARGVRQELYGIYLVHFAMQMLLVEATAKTDLDHLRLSFSDGPFELSDMVSLALIIESEEVEVRLLARLRHKMARYTLPPRRLRINHREII